MIRTALLIIIAGLMIAGCLSISSTSETPMPDLANACHGREQLCRELCGSAGVQSFTCNARAGVSFDYRCECRARGTAL